MKLHGIGPAAGFRLGAASCVLQRIACLILLAKHSQRTAASLGNHRCPRARLQLVPAEIAWGLETPCAICRLQNGFLQALLHIDTLVHTLVHISSQDWKGCRLCWEQLLLRHAVRSGHANLGRRCRTCMHAHQCSGQTLPAGPDEALQRCSSCASCRQRRRTAVSCHRVSRGWALAAQLMC